MFKFIMAMLLALTVGWKVAIGLTDNAEKDFKPMLVKFLVRHHFAVSEVNDVDDMSILKAIAGDCRLLVTKDAQGWNHDIIQQLATVDDRVFFVFRRAIYTSLPTWSAAANDYWLRFLRKIPFIHADDTPIVAVIAPARCDAERLPWHELSPTG